MNHRLLKSIYPSVLGISPPALYVELSSSASCSHAAAAAVAAVTAATADVQRKDFFFFFFFLFFGEHAFGSSAFTSHKAVQAPLVLLDMLTRELLSRDRFFFNYYYYNRTTSSRRILRTRNK